jgi:hypothetical protein
MFIALWLNLKSLLLFLQKCLPNLPFANILVISRTQWLGLAKSTTVICHCPCDFMVYISFLDIFEDTLDTFHCTELEYLQSDLPKIDTVFPPIISAKTILKNLENLI